MSVSNGDGSAPSGGGARWSPSGFDIAGSSRPAWVPFVFVIVALALLIGFYAVVNGAVQRAEQVHRNAQGAAAIPHMDSTVHALL